MEKSPATKGLRWRLQLLDAPMVPKDVRGIVLACGFIASATFGLGTLLTAGDPIGWVYLAISVAGLAFLPTRLVPTTLWLLVASGGIAVGLAGNASGWIEFGLGLVLAAVGLMPSTATAHPRIGSPLQTVAIADPAGNRALSAAEPTIGQSTVVADSPAEATALGVAPAAVVTSKVEIRAFGHLEVRVDGRSLNTRLEPRLKFLLSYLLARHLVGVQATERTLLSEEVAPGIDPGSQKERLRKQLHELQSSNAAVAQVIRADRQKVWLELDAVDCDAVRLISCTQQMGTDEDLVDKPAADRLTGLLEATQGEFLSGFEDLDNQVTRSRSAATDTIRNARVALAEARARLAHAAANHHLAAGRGQLAIPLLLDVLETTPSPDIARLLVAAYVQTGQISRARDIRREYSLTEEN